MNLFQTVDVNSRLRNTVLKISKLDWSLGEDVQRQLDQLTKPQGSLGKLENLAKKIVVIKGNSQVTLRNKVIFILAGDHGICEEGVSAFPQEVTVQMVKNFLNGGAGINVLARQVGARVVIGDLGVKGHIDDSTGLLKRKKINCGTNNLLKSRAMNTEHVIQALEAGIDIFEEEYAYGIDIIGVGEMGIGNTTAASAIISIITQQNVRQVTGRGTGIDQNAWEHKVEVITQALQQHQPKPDDAIDILSKVGGYEIAGMAGVMLAAAAHRIPVLLDGFISTSAGLLAYLLSPNIKDYFIAAHNSVEQGHQFALNHLDLDPLLDLNLRLGEGSGAALAMYFSDAALKILNEMATFSQASVSQQHKEK